MMRGVGFEKEHLGLFLRVACIYMSGIIGDQQYATQLPTKIRPYFTCT